MRIYEHFYSRLLMSPIYVFRKQILAKFLTNDRYEKELAKHRKVQCKMFFKKQ